MPRQNVATNCPAIEDRYADTMRERAIRHSGDMLVSAQLRAGQHYLALPLARAVATSIGFDPRCVRPGIGAAIA
ncbi:hypothetical protein [Sphingomonas sp. DC2300-3]|uniref:hypothetical protein n=1 Tax=unclassified Sphingomonas TaxID=196159 RepID=UPI003CF8B6AE